MSEAAGEFQLADPSVALGDHQARRIGWDDSPSARQRDEIVRLAIRPSPTQLGEGRMPAWVAELPHCRSLSVPILWLPSLRAEQLPTSLDTLILDVDLRFTERDGSNAPPWPSELVLPRLRRLELGHWVPIVPRGLRVEHLPRLECFAGVVDDRVELLELLAPFPHLRELQLGNVRKLDVFEDLDGAIECLRLRGGTRGFPLDLITRWPSLRELQLAAMHGPIDCSILTELPRLASLELFHCKKLLDLDALLDAPALRRLGVTACGRPFDAALRAAFVAHGFELLDIERA